MLLQRIDDQRHVLFAIFKKVNVLTGRELIFEALCGFGIFYSNGQYKKPFCAGKGQFPFNFVRIVGVFRKHQNHSARLIQSVDNGILIVIAARHVSTRNPTFEVRSFYPA